MVRLLVVVMILFGSIHAAFANRCQPYSKFEQLIEKSFRDKSFYDLWEFEGAVAHNFMGYVTSITVKPPVPIGDRVTVLIVGNVKLLMRSDGKMIRVIELTAIVAPVLDGSALKQFMHLNQKET